MSLVSYRFSTAREEGRRWPPSGEVRRPLQAASQFVRGVGSFTLGVSHGSPVRDQLCPRALLPRLSSLHHVGRGRKGKMMVASRGDDPNSGSSTSLLDREMAGRQVRRPSAPVRLAHGPLGSVTREGGPRQHRVRAGVSSRRPQQGPGQHNRRHGVVIRRCRDRQTKLLSREPARRRGPVGGGAGTWRCGRDSNPR